MYLIIRISDEGTDYFGPFPTEDRAREYAKSFENWKAIYFVPLIVPNCVQVKLVY